ncbi:MAG: hypothetical protein ACKO8J_00885, partial [Candidatus Limnocylindrus sp.]
MIGNLDALGGLTPKGDSAASIPPLASDSENDRAATDRRVPEEVATRAAMGMLYASGAVLKDGSGRPGIDVRVEPQVL